MNRNIFGMRVVWVAVLAVASTAVPAVAQQPDAGPYGDLFGAPRKAQTQSLDIRGSLFGGYDDNLLAQSPNSNGASLFDPRLQVPGATTGLNSTATYGYVHTGQGKSATQFRVTGAGSVQEFTGPNSKPYWTQNYNAATALSTNLTPRVLVTLNGTASYMPYYQYVPLIGTGAGNSSPTVDPGAPSGGAAADNGAAAAPPGGNIPPSISSPAGSDVNFATQAAFVESWSAGATVSDQMTKRSTISATVQWDETQVSNLATIQSRSARAQLRHRLTRALGVHAGIGLQDVRFGQGPLPGNQILTQLFDVGVDFNEGITIARHYRLTFSTGTSALRQDTNTQFIFTGNVALARSIGRTWSASIGAVRGTSYIVGFGNPFVSDTATASLGGYLARRLSLNGSVNYMRGQSLFSASTGSLVSETASTKLTFAVAQHVGVYAQYAYYQYDVPGGLFSSVSFPPQLHRRSASVGLSFWVPMINQRSERRP